MRPRSSLTSFIAALLCLILTGAAALPNVRGCVVPWRTENAFLYVELSPFSRVRIQPSEFAIRIHGMAETNESLFAKIENNQAIRITARRESRNGARIVSHVVFEGVAVKKNERLLWALRFNGDAPGALARPMFISNVSRNAEPFTCEYENRGGTGALHQAIAAMPGISFLPDRIIEIQDDSVLAKQLGF